MKLFERVLIVSDLGPQSHALISSLSELVRQSESHVLMHYIQTRNTDVWREPSPEDRWQHLSQELLDAGVRRVDFEISTGNPTHAIERSLEEFAATLVVISEGPESKNNQSWFGTVAQRLNRRIQVPLLVMPASSPHIMHPLLCLVDSSDSSKEALLQAVSLARKLRTSLTILHVVPEGPIGPVVEGPLWTRRTIESQASSSPNSRSTLGLFDNADADLVRRTEDLQRMMKARRELEFLLAQVDLSDVNHETLLLSGSPVAQTLSVARTRHSGLIFVGAQHSSGLTHLMAQSSAEVLVSVADLPVLICHGAPRPSHLPKQDHPEQKQLDAGF